MTRWIHGISREFLRAAFCEYFGIAVEHADILILLYERRDETVTTRKMQVLINSHRPPKRSVIYERIRVLREIMEAESLDSGGQLDDTGYSLTDIGREECRAAIQCMAIVLLKHAQEQMEAGAELKALPAPDSTPLRTAAGDR